MPSASVIAPRGSFLVLLALVACGKGENGEDDGLGGGKVSSGGTSDGGGGVGAVGGQSSGGAATSSGGSGSGAFGAGGSAGGSFGGAPGGAGGTDGVGGTSGAGGFSDGGTFSSGGSASSPNGGGGGIDLGPVGSDGFALDVRLASELKDTAPSTVGIVRWDFRGPHPDAAHIAFGLDTTYGKTAPVDLSQPAYRTLLLGLKPNRTYHFQIVASAGSTTSTSADYTLTTGAPPDELVVELSRNDPTQVDPGFLIGSSWDILGSNLAGWSYILDTEGELVWWYRPDESEHPYGQGYGRARLSADSQDMWLALVSNGGGPLLRVSMDTLEEQAYPDVVASHDICAQSGDTMAFVDYESGECGGVVEIDRAGNTRQVFDPNSAVGLQTCHGNAIRYSAGEDVYLYSALEDDVFVIGRDGQLRGTLSDSVAGGTSSWGGLQHGVHLLSDRLLLFANSYPGGSAVVEYDLLGNLLRTIPAAYQVNFYGDVQRLPSGNTLVTTGHLVQIVTPQDTIAFEASVMAPDSSMSYFGYLEFRDSLYGPALDTGD